MLGKIHRYSAVVLVAFAAWHIANHLVGLSGVASHIDMMNALRLIYRQPVVESVLLASVAIQIFTGVLSLVRGWKQRRGVVAWLQAISGAYIAFFFLNHVGAVLYGRTVLTLDTNIYFAAAGFYVQPMQFYFAPYYFLAVLALFAHLGCALYWLCENQKNAVKMLALSVPMLVGGVISAAIVLMLAGEFFTLEIPPEYNAMFGFMA